MNLPWKQRHFFSLQDSSKNLHWRKKSTHSFMSSLSDSRLNQFFPQNFQNLLVFIKLVWLEKRPENLLNMSKMVKFTLFEVSGSYFRRLGNPWICVKSENLEISPILVENWDSRPENDWTLEKFNCIWIVVRPINQRFPFWT